MSASAILIVEDEFLISLTLAESLEDAGYSVITTFNADEAISVLESRTDIRMIITDIDMPGSMDGLKLAAAVSDRWPPIKIIVTSGKHRPGKSDLPDGSFFLAKPYRLSQLTEVVRQAW
jgi:DNA-binding NtrC family response regulator